ncbi:bile salt sulfotransferase-like isoform X2 [Varroa jacobsoni]|uniref:Sulfotransferase domain-containing protein n=1 Tax=Varroa destructor TaxID=109461 RepID=A0A7M7J9L1_VARDE|nr:bile salt sulfotransferase-like isoform X2 [Varroa destructor]XP_022698439.1 bile salt sulfotransferase-like isoform X2 [Varroa jacobsoni]
MKKPYACKLEGGYIFPVELRSECIREALQFVPRNGDIGVVTYPRSGTTWIQQIVLRLLRHDDFSGSWNELALKSPCLELQGTQGILESFTPVFYKTHIPYHPSRFNPNSKYIWVLRNPRDVCVSSYCLYSDLHKLPWRKRYSFEAYTEHFCSGNVYYGGYWEHLRSWWQVKDEPNVLMLVYEKMKRNPKGTIIAIGEFLGENAAELVKDEQLLDALIKCTSVKATRREANANFVRSLLRFNKLDISLTKELLRPRRAVWKIFGGEVEEVFNQWIQKQEDHEDVMALFE